MHECKRFELSVLGIMAVTLGLLVASPDVKADECSNALYRTGASASLPDCRAYEQVSSTVKNGVGVLTLLPVAGTRGVLPGWAADDGNRIIFNTNGGSPALATPERGISVPQIAERDSFGWHPRLIVRGIRPDLAFNPSNWVFRAQIPTADRTGLLAVAATRWSPDQPLSGGWTDASASYVRSDGTVEWLTRPTAANPDPPFGSEGVIDDFGVVGISEDQSTTFVASRQSLTPADVESGRTLSDRRWALYRVKGGVLENVGVLPSGGVDPAGSMSAGLDNRSIATSNLTATLGNGNVISRDGRRALFLGLGERVVPGRTAQLYLYREGQPTLLVSAPQPADRVAGPAPLEPIPGSAGVVPIGAYGSGAHTHQNTGSQESDLLTATGDRDLRTVLFATPDKLTEDAPSEATTVKVYRYVAPIGSEVAGQLQYLPELSYQPIGPMDFQREMLGNVYRMSDDGSRILFWTQAGELKLWREGASTLTLAGDLETVEFLGQSVPVSTNGVRFSSDSRTVVFMSTRPIGGEQNHPLTGLEVNRTQIYRFDERRDGSTPRCVSCPPIGAVARGPATFDLQTSMSSGFGSASSSNIVAAQSRGISADGRRVFFTTSSTLDPRDHNGVADVYEWSASRAEPMLLSSGAAASLGEGLVDIDASGDNVFFVSEARLAASDTDELSDLYVARRGGGLPGPPGADDESLCALGECQGAGQGGGPLAAPKSGELRSRAGGAKDPGSSGVRRRFAVERTRSSVSRVSVGVALPASGIVRVSGGGVRGVTRTVSRAGTFTVHVPLTAATRRRVARNGTALIWVRARFVPRVGSPEARTVRIKLKRTRGTSRRVVR